MLSSNTSKSVEARSISMVPSSDQDEGKMFAIHPREDNEGRVVVVGKASRKRATTLINIPISEDLKTSLDERVVGSLSMATAALLQWAFDELERQEISIEARPQK
ncbi:MAG: hypothetical protein WA970_09080 [Gammaproteobacteria bacterium]|jgi:hypothetical protein